MSDANKYIQNQYLAEKIQVESVFETEFGANTIDSVSLSPVNRFGVGYMQVPAGAIMGKHRESEAYFRICFDAAVVAVAAANDIEISDSQQFRGGELVELPIAGGTSRFRTVDKVDRETNKITLDGAAFSLDAGDKIEVDPTRSFATVATTGTVTVVELGVGEAEEFEHRVGEGVEIGSASGLTIDAVDLANDTITISASTSVTAGERVVSDRWGEYKILVETVNAQQLDYTPQNLLAPYRQVGRVKRALLRGLTPTVETELLSSGRIQLSTKTV